MSAEWLTAIATAGTFVVIAASAVAALMQLRHMRSSNQIIALSEIRETLESPGFETAMKYVHHEFPRLLADPDVRKRLLAPGPTPNEFIPVRTVSSFFEQFGAFVKRGVIDRDIVCDLYGPPVLTHWAMSKAWIERHPGGAYPRHAARMPQADYWPELRAQNEHDVDAQAS